IDLDDLGFDCLWHGGHFRSDCHRGNSKFRSRSEPPPRSSLQKNAPTPGSRSGAEGNGRNRRGLLPTDGASSGNLVMLRDLVENAVATFPSLFDIAGLEGKTEAFRSGIRFMYGQMTPPDAAIVPKVVIGVFVVHSER